MKFILITSLIFIHLFGAPAYNELREFKHSDGTVFKARASGNHHLNWLETEEGEVLKHNPKSGNFEYAEIKKERLKASGARYEKNNSKRARSISHVNKISKKELYRLWAKKRAEAKIRRGY